MLVKYKKNYEKIAMGLLSFTPGEKDIKKLLELIKLYENNENWQIYLYKLNEDFIGIVGVVTDDTDVELKHLCVNPSHRNQGLGKKIVHELIELYKDKNFKAMGSINSFLEQCKCETQI
ncbi:MAG: N-acetyltransferase [Bacillales bacterium]|jgi:riboflavin biosynthesis RibT protein|nr:N-acetyltransferase [Bacillales bacterium]